MNEPTETHWYRIDAEETARRLNTRLDHGLHSEIVTERLQRYGKNALPEGKRRSFAVMLAGQFADFMIAILIVAAIISGLLGELTDAIVIFVIVFLNAIIGLIQEYRAQQAIAALRTMAAPTAQVIRGGKLEILPADTLVPGDLVVLENGNIAPADLRIIDATQLQLDEAALTGESQPAEKQSEPLQAHSPPLADRCNMAYKGTLVTRGRGSGIVVATGLQTELGKIATLLEASKELKTPLQIRLTRFGQRLALSILAICVILFIAGLLRGEPVMLMFLTAVSLAVAAIPEALPAVVTMTLAIGASKMSRHNALIRHLPAVETLGSVTYICSDKTGTLTQNRMHVESIWCDDTFSETIPENKKDEAAWRLLGNALSLNNDVSSTETGEPTELALFHAAKRAGYDKEELIANLPRIDELPFDSQRKLMTTLHSGENGIIAFTKGAPERLLERCENRLSSSGIVPIEKTKLHGHAEELAARGFRLIAFAYREWPERPGESTPEKIETNLTFLGFVALIDPPREEVPQAVTDCRTAGIIPVMITGDHPATAHAIAKRLGIAINNNDVMTGEELDALSGNELRRRLDHVRVFARVSPEQKITIVGALQEKGEFVAMTGDGVNDAPALRRADIGVAMGQKGTDVAREAADMVLLDDNFSTIVSAAREGRRIFDNIRKFVKYTMTSNSGEIWTLLLAPFMGLPIPLLPIHILWINLVTDGLPGLALAMEGEEKGIMRRPPRPPNENIFAHGMWQHIIWVGLLIGGISIITQAYAIHVNSKNWQTMVFFVLTFAQLLHSLVIRSETQTLFTRRKGRDLLLATALLTVVLQLAVIYLPFCNAIFKTHPLTMQELLFCFTFPFVILIAVETEKWLVRKGKLYAG